MDKYIKAPMTKETASELRAGDRKNKIPSPSLLNNEFNFEVT